MTPRHLGLALIVVLFWGFSFIAANVALVDLPPLLLAALRFACAAMAAFIVPRPDMPWRSLVPIAGFMFVAQFGLLFTALRVGLPPGLASVVAQIQVPFTLGFAFFMLRERPSGRQLAGSAVAVAGLGAISATIDGRVGLAGLLLAIVASAAWACGNVLVRRLGRVDTFRLIVWLCTIPPLPLLVLSLWLEGPARDMAALRQITPAVAGAVVYLALPTTLGAYGLWAYLLKLYPTATVAPFSMLVPVIGATAAAVILGETFVPLRLVGMAAVLAGVAIAVLPGRSWGARFGPRRPSPAPRHPAPPGIDADQPVR